MAKYTSKTVLERLKVIQNELNQINKNSYTSDSVWKGLDKIKNKLHKILDEGYDEYKNENNISYRVTEYQGGVENFPENDIHDHYTNLERKERKQQEFIEKKWNDLNSLLQEYIEKFELLSSDQEIKDKKESGKFITNVSGGTAYIADQMNIGSINTTIDKMMKAIDDEPHLTVEIKKEMKGKLSGAKNALNEFFEEGVKHVGGFVGGALRGFCSGSN